QAARVVGCEIEVGVPAAAGGSQFTVTETAPSGRVATYSESCTGGGSVVVAQHQAVGCTATTTAVAHGVGQSSPNAVLTVTGRWEDRSGGNASDVTISVLNQGTTVASFGRGPMRSLSGGACTLTALAHVGC